MEVFQQIHKNFGFGMMRLPMKDGEVDVEQTNKKAGITSLRMDLIILIRHMDI